ncbi:MAG: hypothetical protein LWY06_01165 [Firmicutes bacterium]|nr:hypothetical protein [Bacillota bacterium]
MPKIWLMNLDELVPRDDLLYESFYVPVMVKKNLIRYLICMEPGDYFISAGHLCHDFAGYIANLKGLNPDLSWLITLDKISTPYSLASSIIMNPDVMEMLREMGRKGTATFEPYLETTEILKLSKLTGIPSGRTPATLVRTGLIRQLNHKGRFEEIAVSAGAKTAEGFYSETQDGILYAISEMDSKGFKKLMLRKAEYAGGAGNLSGTPDELIKALPEWYNGGGVKIEEFLDLKCTIGSLALIGDDGYMYLGDDEQIFVHGLWSGFSYPCSCRETSIKIRNLTLSFAEIIYKMGARGYLNMDWGIVNRNGENEIIAIEINFRHNGLSCMVDLAAGLPGGLNEHTNLLYYGKYSLPEGMEDFSMLEAVIRKIQFEGRSLLIEKPDTNRGVIISTPILDGKAGLLIVGDSAKYTESVRELLNLHLQTETPVSEVCIER